MSKKITCRFCGKPIGESTAEHLATAHPLMTLAGAVLLSPLILAAAVLQEKKSTVNVSVRERNSSGFSGPFYDE